LTLAVLEQTIAERSVVRTDTTSGIEF